MVLSHILLKNNFKKSVLYQQLFLQLLCVAGYLKHSNDTPKRNIYKYTNYNITEIYINSLSTTTQIFIEMDYLIMMSENIKEVPLLYEVPLFYKKKKTFGKDIFSLPRRSNWIYVLIHIFWRTLKKYGL